MALGEAGRAREVLVRPPGPEQFVANVVRFSHDPSGRARHVAETDRTTDGEFDAALNEWDRQHLASERRKLEAPPPDPRLVETARGMQEEYEQWALRAFGRIGRDLHQATHPTQPRALTL